MTSHDIPLSQCVYCIWILVISAQSVAKLKFRSTSCGISESCNYSEVSITYYYSVRTGQKCDNKQQF